MTVRCNICHQFRCCCFCCYLLCFYWLYTVLLVIIVYCVTLLVVVFLFDEVESLGECDHSSQCGGTTHQKGVGDVQTQCPPSVSRDRLQSKGIDLWPSWEGAKPNQSFSIRQIAIDRSIFRPSIQRLQEGPCTVETTSDNNFITKKKKKSIK